jgi:alpha-beta hydrolase superfamily lysophospholipase
VNHQSGTVTGSSGAQLRWDTWLPDHDPRGVVVLSHGWAEHAGRYAPIAQFLTDRGFAFYAHDHLAHGKSEGAPRAYFDTFKIPVRDLLDRMEVARSAHPELPLFLYAHSMGTLVGLLALLERQPSGAIITGTPLDLESQQPPWLGKVSAVLAALFPHLPVQGIPAEGISSDPEVVKDYVSDPLNYHGKIRARMGHNMVLAARGILARASTLALPLLILHGAADPICPPSGSQKLHDAVSAKDKQLTFYPKLRHEVHNEIDKKIVWDDIGQWLEQHA